MKVAMIHKHGGGPSFTVEEVSKPEITKDEALVRVKAGGVNPVDNKLIDIDMKTRGNGFSRRLGTDFSGQIVDLGSRVADFCRGDEVYGMVTPFRPRSFSEFLAVKARAVSLKPQNLTAVEASVCPVAALTALQALRDLGKIHEGSRVLINGSSGGVGHFAIQIAKAFGGHVTGICSGEHTDFCLELGADSIINYERQDATADSHYDIFFDVAAKYSLKKARPLLKPKGRYITTVPSPRDFLPLIFSALFPWKRMNAVNVKSRADDLKLLAWLTEEGKIRPAVQAVYPMSRLSQALDDVRGGHTRGKIAVDLTTI